MAIIHSPESSSIALGSVRSGVEGEEADEGSGQGGRRGKRQRSRNGDGSGSGNEVKGAEDEDEGSGQNGKKGKRQRGRNGDGSGGGGGGGNELKGAEDEDEANADLSLHIVAKAEQRRKKRTLSRSAAPGPEIQEVEVLKTSTSIDIRSGPQNTMYADLAKNSAVEGWEDDADPLGRNSSIEEGEVVELMEPAAPRGESPEEGELQEDADAELNPILATELPDAANDDNLTNPDEQERGKWKKKKEKREKKEKKKKQKGGGRDNNNNTIIGGNSDSKAMVVEIQDGDAEESMVMRKLLRGPRYFDPPEEQDQSCFNCGKVGHIAVSCPDGPRLKPCYVCGGFGHEGRECPQKTECYVCGKVGHIAKYCPNTGAVRASALLGDERGGGTVVCLHCGRHGHEVSSCYYSYDGQDLALVQCYICNEFGHLSCVAVVDTSPFPVSCYECGEMGHTGAGCARPRRSDRGGSGNGMASVCFKCGEEGHYARGCSRRNNGPWPAPWPTEGTPRGGPSRNENRYSTPRSASRMPRWMDLQEREPRWSPLQRLGTGGTPRWSGSRSNNASGSAGREAFVSAAEADEDLDSYMGPIANFTTESPNDGYRKRRKRSWTSTSAR